jgi:hypothetical protein
MGRELDELAHRVDLLVPQASLEDLERLARNELIAKANTQGAPP